MNNVKPDVCEHTAMLCSEATTGGPPAVVDAEEAACKLQQMRNELEQFWRDILPIMDQSPETSSVNDVARLSCPVDSQTLTLSPDDSGDSKVDRA